jgi:hypothetical protein
MSNKGYRLVFEEPPTSRAGRRPTTAGNAFAKKLAHINENHRNEWVRLFSNKKHISNLYSIRKNAFPNMELVTRKNTNGTYGVWVRFVDKPVKVRRRTTTKS